MQQTDELEKVKKIHEEYDVVVAMPGMGKTTLVRDGIEGIGPTSFVDLDIHGYHGTGGRKVYSAIGQLANAFVTEGTTVVSFMHLFDWNALDPRTRVCVVVPQNEDVVINRVIERGDADFAETYKREFAGWLNGWKQEFRVVESRFEKTTMIETDDYLIDAIYDEIVNSTHNNDGELATQDHMSEHQ